MVQLLAYHATDAANVDSIRQNGLEARLTCEHNYEHITVQPKGVYVLPQGSEHVHGSWGAEGPEAGRACVVVNMLGLPMQQDMLIDDARYCPDDIPPERIVAIVEPKLFEGPLRRFDYCRPFAVFEDLRYAA